MKCNQEIKNHMQGNFALEELSSPSSALLALCMNVGGFAITALLFNHPETC